MLSKFDRHKYKGYAGWHILSIHPRILYPKSVHPDPSGAMPTSHPPSSKDDILQFLVKHSPSTAQQLADHLQISPQATRRHLKDLEAEGLIEHSVIHAGMGRPQYQYSLSDQGRDHLPDQYDDFAVSLLPNSNSC